MSAYIYRPVKGALFVWFDGHGYEELLLRRIVPKYTRVTAEGAYWRVSRSQLRVLQNGLAELFGSVEVRVQGAAQTTCVEACWSGNPDNASECVCACAGSNHGSLEPLGTEVIPGLSIQTDYSVWTYTVERSPIRILRPYSLH